MTTASKDSQRIRVENRKRDKHDVCTVEEANSLITTVEANARTQRLLGLGDPTLASASVKLSFREIVAKAQANELAEIFTPVKSPDGIFPRAETYNDRFKSLPEIVVCQLRSGTTHARCSVGRVAWWSGKNYEAPIPLMPIALLELVSRAKGICPDAEFHIVMRPCWQNVPQLDPVLLVRVPLANEYFEVGCWDGDQELLKSLIDRVCVDEE